ncbi:MAG: c-type cytochrome [Chitinophagaceae bacterium]
MIPCKPKAHKLTLLSLIFVVFAAFQVSAQDGKALFQANCASCHNVFNKGTGPALGGVLDKEYYGGSMDKIYEWVANPGKLIAADPYYAALKAEYGSVMTAFPALKKEEIDAIFAHINQVWTTPKDDGPKKDDGTPGTSSSQNAIIFGIISLILGIIALILMQVNSNLKKMSDDAEGIVRPEPVPFYRNKVYIAMLAVVFFIVGGFFIAQGAIGLQRQKNYEPVQPIFYSHKVHAGINQINCLYCHGNAWESKHAAVPSTNVCMNCHKTIQEYKGPQLYDRDGKEVNGTAEIAKLYSFAGFDPNKPNDWDASKAKQIPWVKIHNLPDHVYFSHAQHVRAGNVQCQTCHGEITAMDEVYQFSELSMGWCINCHRQTAVNFNYDSTKGNQFYSIYEKFHNDFKSGKMDSIRVEHIGGLECQKCHY